MIVVTDAPMNPSQVFLGDNLINGVFPKKKPKMYAAISLMTISDAGRRNLHSNWLLFKLMKCFSFILN